MNPPARIVRLPAAQSGFADESASSPGVYLTDACYRVAARETRRAFRWIV